MISADLFVILVGLMRYFFLFLVFLFFLPKGWGKLYLDTNACKPPLLAEVQKITCANYDLRTAIQRDNLLRKVSQTNVFQNVSPQDVVRSEESLSIFNQALKERIEETHKEYQEKGDPRYTLSIASFPSDVKNNSCAREKTIDFSSPQNKDEEEDEGGSTLSLFGLGGDDDDEDDWDDDEVPGPPVAQYIPLSDKPPRTFQIRVYKGKAIMCENTTQSYSNRLSAFCGKKKENCDDDSMLDSKYCNCKEDLTPSCGVLDKKGAKKTSPTNCVSGEQFAKLSKKLLLSNIALEWKYCPGDCSYYTQTVQAFYKNKNNNKKKYCSDNYLIVHCGPKKTTGMYNLNIREIDDICRDFEICQRYI